MLDFVMNGWGGIERDASEQGHDPHGFGIKIPSRFYFCRLSRTSVPLSADGIFVKTERLTCREAHQRKAFCWLFERLSSLKYIAT
ncbi:MAG: hypothetical protein ACC608_13165 [Anaerofustis sp.]